MFGVNKPRLTLTTTTTDLSHATVGAISIEILDRHLRRNLRSPSLKLQSHHQLSTGTTHLDFVHPLSSYVISPK
jgi:hypothetical protein